MTDRVFSAAAGTFGPLRPGEWEAVFALSGNIGGAAIGAAFKFCQTITRTAATAADALVPTKDLLTVTTVVPWKFSVPNDKRYISFIATQAVTVALTLRRLKTR